MSQQGRQRTIVQSAGEAAKPWRVWNHKMARTTQHLATNSDTPDIARKCTLASAREQRCTKRENDKQLRQERQEIEKEKAKKYKEEKQVRADAERARKKFIGGIQWGFDATAGIRQSAKPNDDAGYFVSMGHLPQRTDATCEVDEIGRFTGRRWTEQTTFGIEYGGPGKEGKYGHGSLKKLE